MPKYAWATGSVFLNVKVRPTAICVGWVCRITILLFDTLKWTENTKHALIQAMSSQAVKGNSENLDKYARLLYDAAIIGEGEAIDDPRDFAGRLVDVMEKALKQK